MGTQPPELEIRDIGDLTVDQFRGIFRLTYSGDAHLVLKTKVQANPLNHKQPDIHLMTGSIGMLAAKQPLAVPMLLRLSHFRLSSYVVLVVSKQKGITLVFKTDPLQNVDINSTFDSIAVIQKFIQREIEGQLRQMFREDLPGIIHRLSQQWFKAKVEAPYLNKRFPSTPTKSQPLETMSSPDIPIGPLSAGPGLPSHLGRAHSVGAPSIRRPRSVAGNSVASLNRRASSNKIATTSTPSPQTSSPDPSSHGEYENFDPTYGLRPEGLPTKSGFKGFSSLFMPNKGLADLTEEPSGDEDDDDYEDDGESTSYDVVEWEDTAPGISPPTSVYTERGNTPEYETIPAVGGGTITRPRILHSQSTIQPPSGITPHLSPSNPYSRSQGNIRSGAVTPSILTRHHSSGSSYFPDISSLHNIPRTTPPRPRTPDSADSSMSGGINDHTLRYLNLHHSRHPDPISPTHHLHPHAHSQDLDSNPIYIRRPNSERRLSVSSSVSHQTATTTTSLLYPTNSTTDPMTTTLSTSPGTSNSPFLSAYPHASGSEPNSKIIRPSLNNNSIHHLSTLSHSNHTLSPYTRSLSHFTVRSVPPRSWSAGGLSGSGAVSGLGHTGGERQQHPIKAKRKRIFRIGGKKSTDSTMTAATIGLSTTTVGGASTPSRYGYLNSTNAEFIDSHSIAYDGRGGHHSGVGGGTEGGDHGMAFGLGLGPGGLGPPSGAGTNSSDRMHYLRQHQSVPAEFDAEDMDRYFRSNDDLSSVPPPPPSSIGGASLGPSSPPRRLNTTMQAAHQHLHQVSSHQGQGVGIRTGSPVVPVSVSESSVGGGGTGGIRRRQVSSNPSRLR